MPDRANTRVAFIGLGSNLDDPKFQVRRALVELQSIRLSHLLRHSSLYRSAPVGPPNQPDYVNAVAALETSLSALDLLGALQTIERAHGRTRSGLRWGPRTLDLDLLLFGDTQVDEQRLTVPHPRIAERAFVLHPWYEIAPDISVPGLGRLVELVRNCPPQRLERITDDAP